MNAWLVPSRSIAHFNANRQACLFSQEQWTESELSASLRDQACFSGKNTIPSPRNNQTVSGSQTPKQIQNWPPTSWEPFLFLQQAHIFDPWVPNTSNTVSSWLLALPSSSPPLCLEKRTSMEKPPLSLLNTEDLKAHLLHQLKTAYHKTSYSFCLLACLLKTEFHVAQMRKHPMINEYSNKSFYITH